MYYIDLVVILIKRHIVVNINDKFTEIILITRHKYKLKIEDKMICEIPFINKNSKLNENYIEIVLNNIKDKFINNNLVKGIYFNIQNDQIIIRNIENIKTKKHNEIINLIKFEINQYMPIDLQEYKIRYKIIKKDNKEILQSILFPRKFVDICNEISEKLKIKNKYLNVNFDILQKLINFNMINLTKNQNDMNTVILENRLDDLIVNLIFNNQVLESYILVKNYSNKNLLLTLAENYKLYYYGMTDDYIKSLDVERLKVDDKLQLYNNDGLEECMNYVSTLGMII